MIIRPYRNLLTFSKHILFLNLFFESFFFKSFVVFDVLHMSAFIKLHSNRFLISAEIFAFSEQRRSFLFVNYALARAHILSLHVKQQKLLVIFSLNFKAIENTKKAFFHWLNDIANALNYWTKPCVRVCV